MKIFLTVLLVLILVLSLFIGVDSYAMQLQDETFDRAMISFTIAKGLNAIISLIQGTELSLTPVGVGLTFSVGEVLDPFNDMVERFSWVMLASTVSLGIQKIILTLSAKIYLQVAFSISIISSIGFLWMKQMYSKNYFIIPFKILLFLFILRFGAIISLYSTEILYESVLKTEFVESSQKIEQTKVQLEALHHENVSFNDDLEKTSWMESKILKEMGARYDQIKSKLNISKNLNALQEKISDTSKDMINLITIFIIQTILMPLIFLWLMILSMKWIFKTKVNSDRILLLLNK